MTQPEFDSAAALEAAKAGRSVADLLGFSPNLARALYANAVNEYETRQYTEVINSLSVLVLLDARNVDAWSLLGNAFLREGQFAQALEAWRTAMSLKPNHELASMVARTAVALKNPDAIAEAMLVLVEHLSTPARVTEFGELGEALRALTETPENAVPGAQHG